MQLRQALGWTQNESAKRSGYSARLIRKLEAGGNVKPSTLWDMLQCYHEASGRTDWDMLDYIASDDQAPARPDGQKVADSDRDDHDRQLDAIKIYFDVIYNQRRVDRIAEFVAPEIKFTHGEGEPQFGLAIVQQLASSLLNGFDPIHHTIDQAFIADGQVYCFWHVEMKHAGEFGEVRATGKWVKAQGQTICRFRDGLVVESNDSWDVYDVIRQLNDAPKKWF